MKRSGFKPRAAPLARGAGFKPSASTLKRSGKLAPVGARGKRMRQGKVAPTAEESAWMDAAQAFGCIVCYRQHGARCPAEIHHLKEGDRRMGHLFTLPLCPDHHRGGAGEGPFISRHPWKARFESAYGTEADLLATVRALLDFT